VARILGIVMLSVCVYVGVLSGARPAVAAPMTYEYRVKHPTYGDIGSYTNIIERGADGVHVQTIVRIAVKILGATMYRENADRSELWKDGRLAYFHSITTKNGKRAEVSGEAQGDKFVINGPEGTYVAPAKVQPPNPWSSDCLNSDVMMSSVTGQLYQAQIRDDGEETVTIAGQPRHTRKYEIDTDRSHTIWFDDKGVPVILQSIEEGDPVRLVLTRYPETVNLAAVPSQAPDVR
jgi:hypothetical protein